MNLCVLSGKIISEIEFKFIIKSKNKSIAYFDIELLNGNMVKIKSYDEMADYIYRKFKIGQIVVVEGQIRSDETIECKKLRKTRSQWLIFCKNIAILCKK